MPLSLMILDNRSLPVFSQEAYFQGICFAQHLVGNSWERVYLLPTQQALGPREEGGVESKRVELDAVPFKQTNKRNLLSRYSLSEICPAPFNLAMHTRLGQRTFIPLASVILSLLF